MTPSFRRTLAVVIAMVGAMMSMSSHAGSGNLVFTKSFNPTTIVQNGNSSLTLVLSNTNSSSISGLAFTDTLPAGVVVATPSGLTPVACPNGGAITASAGSGSVSLTGGVLNGNTTCTISLNVTGLTAGIKANTVITSAGNMGNGNQTANATLTVTAAPVLTPTLSQWAMVLFALMLVSFGLHWQRMRKGSPARPPHR